MTETQDIQTLQARDAESINNIKITNRGVRVVMMTDTAPGEARAELLKLIAANMGEKLQLLYTIPTEHEVISLKSLCGEASVGLHVLEMVLNDPPANRITFATYAALRNLLKSGALPAKLVLILDPSCMPPTVDMEIAGGLVCDWLKDLHDRDERAQEPTEQEAIQVTVFCIKSAHERYRHMILWLKTVSIQQHEICRFGFRPSHFTVRMTTTGRDEPFRAAVHEFIEDSSAWLAASRVRHEGTTGHAAKTPEQEYDIRMTSRPALICIMSHEMYYKGIKTLEESTLRTMENATELYIIDVSRQPETWSRAIDVLGERQVHDRFNVLVLDPRVGIIHGLEAFTHAFISDLYYLPQYDQILKRMTFSSVLHRTSGELDQRVGLLNRSRTHSLTRVTVATERLNLVSDSRPRAIWSPSVTKDLIVYMFEAHLTWPTKTLQEMPLEGLPQAEAREECLRRLKLYSCVTGGGVINPDVCPQVQELLQLVPNFNLVVLLSGIKDTETSLDVGRVIIQMALLIHHGPKNFLRHIKTEMVAEDQMDVDDPEYDSEESADALETLDILCAKFLGSTECAGKGLLFRAWACLAATVRHGKHKQSGPDDEKVTWDKFVQGFQVNLNLAHKIVRDAQAIGDLLGFKNAHTTIKGFKLTEDDVIEVEKHLARAYIHELAIFTSRVQDPENDPEPVVLDLRSAQRLRHGDRTSDIFFTPPEKDPISRDNRYAIIFDAVRINMSYEPSIVSELFISTKAVYRAGLQLKALNNWPEDALVEDFIASLR